MRNKRRRERHENPQEKINCHAGEGTLEIAEQHSTLRNSFILAFGKKKSSNTPVFPFCSVQVLILLYYLINSVGISESYLRRHVHKNEHFWYWLTSADFQCLTESNKIKHPMQFTNWNNFSISPQNNLRWKHTKDVSLSRNPHRAIKHHVQISSFSCYCR